MNLLAIDPSVNSCGVALFHEGLLYAATTLKEPVHRRREPDVERCARMAENIVTWALLQHLRIHEIAVEWPQIYSPGKGKNPKGLPGLAAIGCAAVSIIRCTPTLRPKDSPTGAYSYLPHEWASNVPKTTDAKWRESKRMRRIVLRLKVEERIVWDSMVKTHDAGDAVGIGLHHLGRLGRVRVYSRE